MSYIYVMQNERLPGVVQIGMTDGNPELHAQELSNITDVPGRFTVAQQWRLKNAERYAMRIFSVLACYRISEVHFRLPAEGAIYRINNMLHSWGVVNDEGLTKEDAEAMRQAVVLRAEQERVEDEHRIGAEMARAKATPQFQGPPLIHIMSNVIMWCMTWALMELCVLVEFTEHRHQSGWQYLAHVAGVIGLGIVLKMSATKRLAKCSDAVLSTHGSPIR